MSSSRVLKVTAAVIQKDDKFLICQRKPQAVHGNLWEFPGGQCNEKESLPDCLKRELKEELNIEIEVKNFLVKIEQDYDNFTVELYAYEGFIKAGKIEPIGCQDYKWVTIDELREKNYEMTAADVKIIEILHAVQPL